MSKYLATARYAEAAQYLIIVCRIEDTDGLIRSVTHTKFGPATLRRALSMLAEANKLKKADPSLIVYLTRDART